MSRVSAAFECWKDAAGRGPTSTTPESKAGVCVCL